MAALNDGDRYDELRRGVENLLYRFYREGLDEPARLLGSLLPAFPNPQARINERADELKHREDP